MNDDDQKPAPETTGAAAANQGVGSPAPAEQPADQSPPAPGLKKKPARQRATPAAKKVAVRKKPAAARGRAEKAPAAGQADSAAPKAATAALSKLDLVWAITGVVFYGGVGMLILFVLALLAVVTLLLRMASDGQAANLDAMAQGLKIYGAEILQFLCAPLSPMPFPFAPWPGKSGPS